MFITDESVYSSPPRLTVRRGITLTDYVAGYKVMYDAVPLLLLSTVSWDTVVFDLFISSDRLEGARNAERVDRIQTGRYFPLEFSVQTSLNYFFHSRDPRPSDIRAREYIIERFTDSQETRVGILDAHGVHASGEWQYLDGKKLVGSVRDWVREQSCDSTGLPDLVLIACCNPECDRLYPGSVPILYPKGKVGYFSEPVHTYHLVLPRTR
jgi:hypothetical protein